MKTLFLIIFAFISLGVHAQQLEVDGSIHLGDSHEQMPKPGTVRWSGIDFLGWNGSKWISLTSGIAFEGEVNDYDGNSYRTILIDDQEWMVENLRTTRFAEGTVIPLINNMDTWQSLTSGAWCWYDTSDIYELPYGKLYNWHAVNDNKGLCPAGWHIPSDLEWTELTDYLGGLGVAGGQMKEAGHAHWFTPNVGATNSSGYSGLPGSLRNEMGVFEYSVGDVGIWWSSNAAGFETAFHRNLLHQSSAINKGSSSMESGLSVRCLKTE